MTTLTKIIERKMQLIYDFNGTKIKRVGAVPQINATYEIEDGITPKTWRVVDVIHRVTIDDAPDLAEYIEVRLIPQITSSVPAPSYTSTSTG